MNRLFHLNSALFTIILLLATNFSTAQNGSKTKVLNVGETLQNGKTVWSKNKEYRLVMQTDGNLCIYKANNEFVWCSMQYGFDGARLVLQNDGNLVVLDAENAVRWNSKTNTTSIKPNSLQLQNDGTLALMNEGKIVWTHKDGIVKNLPVMSSQYFIDKAMKELSKGFTFTKGFVIDGKGGYKRKIEYTLVFSKDTDYQFQIQGQDGEAKGIILTLYDSKRDRKATSFYNSKFYPDLTYKCRSTGIYYLTFTFKDSESFLGGAALGFKK